MQGMPAKLLPQQAVKPAVKTDVKTSVSANNKVAAKTADNITTPDIQGEAGKAESKNSFADFFSGLIGNEATKVEGKGEKVEKTPAQMAEEAKTQASAETKLDVLLKSKGQEQNQNKNIDNKVLTTDQALSAETLKNINNLLVKSPPPDAQSETVVSDKIAATSTNLDQLLKTLKGDNTEVNEGEVVEPNSKEPKNVKNGSPLDFLLKQSKESDVVSVEGKEVSPEMSSKLGLSSEDFLSHLNMKDVKSTKGDKAQLAMNLDQPAAFDPKELAQKQMNASMKSYGQKQNLLDNGLIKNTNDLAFKGTKSKSAIDELKVPDMKIGADLSHIKESFIAPMNKQENGPQLESQNAGKVLDLSQVKTSNTSEIIKRISDYVQQNQVANSSSLDLTVKHDSLGQFKIQVNKPLDPRSNQMDMQITTTTAEGHDFFVKNEIGLMKNLSQAGIQLSDLKIISGSESMSFTQSDSRQSGQNSQQAPREFMSFDSGDFSNGADRRKELWQEARANQQRYGA